MKTLLIVLLYIYQGDKLQCEHKGPWEQAVVECGTKCFDYYTRNLKKVTEKEGIAIIDVCANPKERK